MLPSTIYHIILGGIWAVENIFDRTPMQQGWCGSVALTSRIGTGSVDVKQGNMVAKPVDQVFSASH